MKSLSNFKKMLALLGAGLLAATASGTALAMRDRGDSGVPRFVERHSDLLASPLSTPGSKPTARPHEEIEFNGQVEVIASDMWVVGERTLAVTADTEIKSGLEIGILAQVHAIQQSDGSLWVSQIEPVGPGGDNSNTNSNSNDNSNENHNGNLNSNDDNGKGNINSNGDNRNNNDNHGDDNRNGNLNSNDRHDDHSGNVNSNSGSDDHSNHNSNDSHRNHAGSGSDHGGHG